MSSRYAACGVPALYEWQAACLASHERAALRGASLAYSAPASGGKTLVAELLLAKALVGRGGACASSSSSGSNKACDGEVTALYVVPFVSLVEEKTRHFKQLWSGDESYGLRVRAPPVTDRRETRPFSFLF